MNRIIKVTLSLAVVLGSINAADACCLWPFGGWWGAGYGGAPAGGYYSAGYPAWPVPVTAGYYSAGYASSADCCVPVCCDPCASGACTSGSCVGSTSSGSLKAVTDPNFGEGAKDEDEGYDRGKEKASDPLDDPPRRRPADDDDFGAGTLDGTGSGTQEPFTETDEIRKKAPMPGATDLPAGEEAGKSDATGTDFLSPEKNDTEPQARAERRRTSVAERSSGLNEVIAPKRLATRSLPSGSTRKATSFAGSAADDKARLNVPVRWISVPMPEGHVRL